MAEEQGGQQGTNNGTQQGTSAEQFAETLINALDNKNRRNENSIVRSFADQYGMTESEVRDILTRERNNRNSKPTAEQQKQIDDALEKANTRLVAAEVKAIGASLGLVDADVAISLLDKSKVKVKDDGSVEGVKEALEALKTSKSYLFAAKTEPPKKTGMRQSQGGSASGGGKTTDSANEALRALFGRKE